MTSNTLTVWIFTVLAASGTAVYGIKVCGEPAPVAAPPPPTMSMQDCAVLCASQNEVVKEFKVEIGKVLDSKDSECWCAERTQAATPTGTGVWRSGDGSYGSSSTLSLSPGLGTLRSSGTLTTPVTSDVSKVTLSGDLTGPSGVLPLGTYPRP